MLVTALALLAYLSDPLSQIILSARGLREPKTVKLLEKTLDPFIPQPFLGQLCSRHCSSPHLSDPLHPIIPSAQEQASLRSVVC